MILVNHYSNRRIIDNVLNSQSFMTEHFGTLSLGSVKTSKSGKSAPNTGPLGLIVGVPGLTGPSESVADIPDVFINAVRGAA